MFISMLNEIDMYIIFYIYYRLNIFFYIKGGIYMKFSDIKMLMRDGDYEVDVELSRLEAMLREYEEIYKLQLNPDFQRGHVWVESQQIAYVEFFLRGGKTGRKIYFNCPNWIVGNSDYETLPMQCVDGLQRITALRRFVNNEIPAFGCYYKDFEDSPRRSQSVFQININSLDTRLEVLEWYLQMNEGGIAHSEKELDRIRLLIEEEKAKSNIK